MPWSSSHSRLASLATLLPIVVGACSTSVPPTDTQSPPPGGQFITWEQIQRSGATTAWDALKYNVRTHQFGEDSRGNPVRIVANRGQGSMVLREDPIIFLDGARMSEITVLRMIPANNLFSIQVFTGPDATTYFGTSAVAGVILLETTMGTEQDTLALPDTGRG
jgi:hypothetical protein